MNLLLGLVSFHMGVSNMGLLIALSFVVDFDAKSAIFTCLRRILQWLDAESAIFTFLRRNLQVLFPDENCLFCGRWSCALCFLSVAVRREHTFVIMGC